MELECDVCECRAFVLVRVRAVPHVTVTRHGGVRGLRELVQVGKIPVFVLVLGGSD